MLLMMMMLSSLLPMMMLSASCAQLSHSAEVDSPMLASLAEHVLFESRFFIVRNTQGSEGPGRGRHLSTLVLRLASRTLGAQRKRKVSGRGGCRLRGKMIK